MREAVFFLFFFFTRIEPLTIDDIKKRWQLFVWHWTYLYFQLAYLINLTCLINCTDLTIIKIAYSFLVYFLTSNNDEWTCIVQGSWDCFLILSRLVDGGTLTHTALGVIAWRISHWLGGVHCVLFASCWVSELSVLFYRFYELCGIYSGATQNGPPTLSFVTLSSYLPSLGRWSHSGSEAVFYGLIYSLLRGQLVPVWVHPVFQSCDCPALIGRGLRPLYCSPGLPSMQFINQSTS